MKTVYTMILLLLFATITTAQSDEQKAMAKLSFMIGDWKGTGSSLPQEQNKPYNVLSKVRYDLDGALIVLQYRSERDGKSVLSLHTVIHYNKEDQSYYYYAFRKKGARPFKGTIVDGRFICTLGDDYRLIFQRTPDGLFNEYGERRVDGVWVKNFEDILYPTTNITF